MRTLGPQLELADYENSDASPPGITIAGLSLLAGIALILAISSWIYRGHYARMATAAVDREAASFRHGPLEQTDIARDWIAQDQGVRNHLDSYGWVDRPAGIVHVPIDRAMELVSREEADRARLPETSR